MREKGKKPLQTHTNFTDFNFSAPDFICKIHRNSHPIGICPICLRDKLNSLICSVCGEQNTFFSCSCSDLIRNSSCSDVGSVGRISFLIENEKQIPAFKNTDFRIENEKQRPILKIPRFEKQRPNSKNTHFGIQSDHDHEEGLKKNGFRRILKFFTKKREKGCSERNREVWILDPLGVSRSRSLCSFRESSSDFAFSSAKNSDFNSSSERASNFSEPRKSSFENRGVRMKNREIDFGNTDDLAFIDLRIDEDKSDLGNIKRGGSCRITERETTGVRREKEKKGKRVWGWILKHNSSCRSKKDDTNEFRT